MLYPQNPKKLRYAAVSKIYSSLFKRYIYMEMYKGAAKFKILGGPITTRKNKNHYRKKIRITTLKNKNHYSLPKNIRITTQYPKK